MGAYVDESMDKNLQGDSLNWKNWDVGAFNNTHLSKLR